MRHGATLLRAALGALCVTAAAASGLAGQDSKGRDFGCDNWSDGRGPVHCELREQTIEPVGAITVDPGMNGGVAVHGWDKAEILVRARVSGHAPTQEEAKRIADQVRVTVDGGDIRAEGPQPADGTNWQASFQVFAPRRTDVRIKTFNGGIALSGLSSNVEFEAMNGGVSIREMGGAVRGRTTNGGLSVTLSGSTWEGEMLDVVTTNGGVSLAIPEGYSARLETGTTHGGVHIDYPVAVPDRREKRISADIGSGGPLVRVMTTNGGVSVKRS